jgi:hypothetical protein
MSLVKIDFAPLTTTEMPTIVTSSATVPVAVTVDSKRIYVVASSWTNFNLQKVECIKVYAFDLKTSALDSTFGAFGVTTLSDLTRDQRPTGIALARASTPEETVEDFLILSGGSNPVGMTGHAMGTLWSLSLDGKTQGTRSYFDRVKALTNTVGLSVGTAWVGFSAGADASRLRLLSYVALVALGPARFREGWGKDEDGVTSFPLPGMPESIARIDYDPTTEVVPAAARYTTAQGEETFTGAVDASGNPL